MKKNKGEGMNSDFGVIGLAVMGRNLALNIERNGFWVSVFNHTPDLTHAFLNGDGRGKKIVAAEDISKFVSSLKKPRRILMMIKAGKPVDSVMESLRPILEKGDIVIDGGNSHFKDTERRCHALEPLGIHFVGMGVSGGEEGALWGPSLMPGGSPQAYEKIEDVLDKISAKVDSGPCLSYIGRGGAGHFVKMVHNGIEYGDLQLIAECYDLLKKGMGLSNPQIAQVFRQWNRGVLKSYLVEITGRIVDFPDDQAPKGELIDQILDTAEQKGTGKWTLEAAIEEAVPVPTIWAAVDARILSGLKSQRREASALYSTIQKPTKYKPDKKFTDRIAQALYASKISAYAQGFALMAQADQNRSYGLRLSEIARIWKGGCIIRAKLLDGIRQAIQTHPVLPNLLLDPTFREELLSAYDAWREVVTFALVNAIPVPAMSASLAYFNTYVTERLPANLIQAQRDYFGAHT